MVFTVFISHSKADIEIVKALYSTLKQSGINVYVAEFRPEPGVQLSQKSARARAGSQYEATRHSRRC